MVQRSDDGGDPRDERASGGAAQRDEGDAGRPEGGDAGPDEGDPGRLGGDGAGPDEGGAGLSGEGGEGLSGEGGAGRLNEDGARPGEGGAGPGESGTTWPGEPGAAPPEPATPQDFDDRWAAIVAELGEPEDVDWDGAPRPAGDDEDASRRGGHVVRPAGDERVLSGRDWAGSDQYEAAEEAVDDLEHFVPPDPGPVLGADPLRTLTWVVAVGVPVLFVVLLVAWRDAPGWLGPVAGVLFLGAVGVLIWRMPHRRVRGDGDDSGAVV
jgi:hypothetical protein